jgi:adenine-specific DNA-methyltransferase
MPEEEPELTLFESFDGLEEMESIDFYKHDANWSNRMILGDSLQVMASLAEREKLRGKVQMIYIDPPYGIKFGSNWQVSTRSRQVKDGNLKDVAREVEQIKAFRDTWEFGIHSYLSYLRDRLAAARDLLTESGSCFVQIGDENMHLVRSLMDEVFGRENFVSQIAFSKTTGLASGAVPAGIDYLIWFGRDREHTKIRPVWRDRIAAGAASNYGWIEMPDGTYRGMSKAEKSGKSPLPSGAAIYKPDNITSQGNPRFDFEHEGKTFSGTYKTTLRGMIRLGWAGRIHVAKNSVQYRRYLSDFSCVALTNLWTDTATGSFTDDKLYVVQTGTKTIERCLMLSTDPGDLVLDPTCGSGTTAFAAEQWGRRWITIDTSRVAVALARQRLMAAKFAWYILADSTEGQALEQSSTTQELPAASCDDIRQGFVCERARRITLGSIANNPDVREGMSREEIAAAIERHAGFETLQDRPYEADNKIRVAGPFTVESLNPHRSLSFSDGPEPRSETETAKNVDAPNFEQSILDNLAKAGVQNGRRQERIAFSAFETYAGDYIQAVGQRDVEVDGDTPSRIAIAIGPQYGTVSPSFVKKAAREAIEADDVDLLAILGFAFDPQVTGLTEDDGVSIEASDEGFASVAGIRKLGRIPVLMVRMNADLLMGEELKKTGAGNLFTVFGEPDIVWDETEEGIVVDLRGVDVYDPTTGEVRSNSTDQIALWMIDTDYDEESFFVRHCYFTGGNDPYKRLKTALKADIDEEAWESLYRTISRPFPRPETGKFAVKVINDYGDEVMKVFEV